MLAVSEMNAERWVSLLLKANVTDLSKMVVAVLDGPTVMQQEDGTFIIYASREHAENLNQVWPEIEEIWKEV